MLDAGLREFAALAYYRLRGWIGAGRHRSTPATTRPRRAMRRPSHEQPARSSCWAPRTPPAGRSPTCGGVPVVNKGVAGQQSFELLERFDRDVACGSAARGDPVGLHQRHLPSAGRTDGRDDRPRARQLRADDRPRPRARHRADPRHRGHARRPGVAACDTVAGWVGRAARQGVLPGSDQPPRAGREPVADRDRGPRGAAGAATCSASSAEPGGRRRRRSRSRTAATSHRPATTC